MFKMRTKLTTIKQVEAMSKKDHLYYSEIHANVRRHNKRIGVHQLEKGIGIVLQRVLSEEERDGKANGAKCEIIKGKLMKTTMLLSEEGFLDLLRAYTEMKAQQARSERAKPMSWEKETTGEG